jgi:hypothetical protein
VLWAKEQIEQGKGGQFYAGGKERHTALMNDPISDNVQYKLSLQI